MEFRTIPAGDTITETERYRIYACPRNSDYDSIYYGYDNYAFRKRGGIYNKIYKLKTSEIIIHVNKQSINFENLTPEENGRISGYINTRWGRKIPDSNPYRFYLFAEEALLSQDKSVGRGIRSPTNETINDFELIFRVIDISDSILSDSDINTIVDLYLEILQSDKNRTERNEALTILEVKGAFPNRSTIKDLENAMRIISHEMEMLSLRMLLKPTNSQSNRIRIRSKLYEKLSLPL